MASSAQWLTFTKPFCGIALAILDGVYDEMLSCRASTYSDPGWATMVIQGRYRVSDVR